MNSFYYKYLACGPAFLYLKKRNFFENKTEKQVFQTLKREHQWGEINVISVKSIDYQSFNDLINIFGQMDKGIT